MGEFMMLMISIFIVFLLAIPWFVIIFGPFLLFYSLLLALIYNYSFALPKVQTIISLLQIEKLKINLISYMNQWPEKVILYARTTEESGHFKVIIQFTSEEYQWTINTRAQTMISALTKINRKLKLQNIPHFCNSNRKFNTALKNSSKNHFYELYPLGLKNNFIEVNSV